MLDGRSILGLAPEDIAEAGLSLVPEGRHVFESLTVRENLFLGTRVRSRERRVGSWDGVLALFPMLRERLDMPAGRLSGGEQQQLVIARALLTEPRVLMIDEPSLGLSPKMTELVMDALRQLQADGMTVLIVEQSVERALALADRIYLIRNGLVELAGTAEELMQNAALHSAYFGVA
jgi:branched-chain amino acid transport system ATP-binding protein